MGWFFAALLAAGLGLLLMVVVLIVGGGVRRDRAGGDRGSARRLLDERYARGEISTEEYRQRRRALDGGP